MASETKKCDYKYCFKKQDNEIEERCCERAAVNGYSKCILHIERDSPKKLIDDFNNEITRSIQEGEENLRFNPYYTWQKPGVDFHGIIAPPNWDARSVLRNPKQIPLYFEKADLSDANLNRINLSSYSFYNANMKNCDLFEANLSKCDLKRANLSNAILNRSDLKGAITWRVKYNRKTQFSYIDTSKTDWSYNQQLRQDISIYQKKEQLKAEFPLIYFFWYLFGDCGRSIFFVLIRIVFIMIIFGLMYLLFLHNGNLLCTYQRCISPFAYSLSAFLRFRYVPPFEVTELMQVMSMIEGVVGYIMLAVLIAIFLSKVKD